MTELAEYVKQAKKVEREVGRSEGYMAAYRFAVQYMDDGSLANMMNSLKEAAESSVAAVAVETEKLEALHAEVLTDD